MTLAQARRWLAKIGGELVDHDAHGSSYIVVRVASALGPTIERGAPFDDELPLFQRELARQSAILCACSMLRDALR